jgi:hypothetical protein
MSRALQNLIQSSEDIIAQKIKLLIWADYPNLKGVLNFYFELWGLYGSHRIAASEHIQHIRRISAFG